LAGQTTRASLPVHWVNRAVSVVGSLRFFLLLVLLLCPLLVLSTILPQGLHDFGVTEHGSRPVIRILSRAGLLDPIHSPWFLVPAALLCINLVICIGKRVRRFTAHPHMTPGADDSRDRVRLSALRSLPRFLTHLGVLILVSGVAIGGMAAFETTLELPHGETVPVAPLVPYRGLVDEGLLVRCDSFSVSHYESGLPREYRSDLTFFLNQEILHQGSVFVNHPISINGIRFIQAHYRLDHHAVITLAHDGQTRSFSAAPGQRLDVGPETTATVVRIVENVLSLGPAVQIEFRSPREQGSVWVFSRIEEILESYPELFEELPHLNPAMFEGSLFSLSGVEPHYTTGLIVAYDPGIPVVGAGAIVMLAGLFLTYLFPVRRARTSGAQIPVKGGDRP